MPKWEKYKKSFRKCWLDLPECKGWLLERGDSAYCRLCMVVLRPQLADLKKHGKTEKHRKIVSGIKIQDPVHANVQNRISTADIKKRTLELRLALHCAVSSSFRSNLRGFPQGILSNFLIFLRKLREYTQQLDP